MDPTTIDSYLLDEMSNAEREKFEESFLADDQVFFEIADRENELVDRYISGGLVDAELRRFEASLVANPARRQKIANGKVLREFIADERPEARTITIAERSGFFAAISDFLRMPALQFASIGLIFLLGFASIFLLMENRRLGTLESELATARQREVELSSEIETAQEATGDLTTDLNAERERIQNLEAEIARLKIPVVDDPTPSNTFRPTIATLILSPAGIRGGPAAVRRVELPSDATRLSIVLTLPPESGERVSLKLNGETLAESRRVGVRKSGEKIVSITILSSRIKDGSNEVAVLDSQGTVIENYPFSVSRKN